MTDLKAGRAWSDERINFGFHERASNETRYLWEVFRTILNPPPHLLDCEQFEEIAIAMLVRNGYANLMMTGALRCVDLRVWTEIPNPADPMPSKPASTKLGTAVLGAQATRKDRPRSRR